MHTKVTAKSLGKKRPALRDRKVGKLSKLDGFVGLKEDQKTKADDESGSQQSSMMNVVKLMLASLILIKLIKIGGKEWIYLISKRQKPEEKDSHRLQEDVQP